MQQTASHILMVRPHGFAFNAQTAVDNRFQSEAVAVDGERARWEFDQVAQGLRQAGVGVLVIDDTPEPTKPDAVFPNNWLVTLPGGRVFLFPMMAPNRRLERRDDIVEGLKARFDVQSVVDLSAWEARGRYLEGTGSMVLDHAFKAIYASLSARTDEAALRSFAQRIGYEAVAFVATDAGGAPVYHTNVMMAVGAQVAVVCLEAITDTSARAAVQARLEATGREIIPISRQQMASFAGNILNLNTKTGSSVIALSTRAHGAFTPAQLQKLGGYGTLLPFDTPTIEANGGSVRCMIAELF